MNRPTRMTLVALALVALPAAANPSASPQADDALRTEIQDRVSDLLQRTPSARAHWRVDLAAPAMMLGLDARVEGATAEERAQRWVASNAAVFGLSADQLQLASHTRLRGRTSVTFQQVYQGVPVHQRQLVVMVKDNGRIQRVVNNTYPVRELRTAGAVDPRAAVIGRFGPTARVAEAAQAKRVVVASSRGAFEAALVHVAPSAEQLEVLEVLVNLSSGEVAGHRSVMKR